MGLLFSMLLLLPAAAAAQRFSYGSDRPRPTQSLSFAYHVVDFTYSGEQALTTTFDYADPAYGITYSRPNVSIAVAFGRSTPPAAGTRERQLLDVSLFTWGEVLLLSASEPGRRRLFVPIVLHSSYRRVSREEADPGEALTNAFNVTVLGLGSGLGFNGALGGRVHLEARATPVLGLATRALGDATGTSRLFEADVLLHLGPFVNRFGLTVGYGFRIQDWNVGASDLLPEAGGDFFDYRGHQHVLRAGLSW